ncbi:MAG: hypothetical protein EP146_17340 [Oscillibacter sp.]|uniref:hypothetical protein n=1 Tax=Oscillibacter sp. TaxID=1945593 RepID=UPI00132BD011|nr:hypothetical protein [Oscillibacter sp.]MUU12956.1 hypothetical protein [Oscillibacter sp.]
MKTMRRYFAMLLTLIMSFSLVTSAAAAETKTVVVGDVSIDFGVEETTVMPAAFGHFGMNVTEKIIIITALLVILETGITWS